MTRDSCQPAPRLSPLERVAAGILAAVLAGQFAFTVSFGLWSWNGALTCLQAAYNGGQRFLEVWAEGPSFWILDAGIIGNATYTAAAAFYAGSPLLAPLAIWCAAGRARRATLRLLGWLALAHAGSVMATICCFQRSNHLFDQPPPAWYAGWFDRQVGVSGCSGIVFLGLYLLEPALALCILWIGYRAKHSEKGTRVRPV